MFEIVESGEMENNLNLYIDEPNYTLVYMLPTKKFLGNSLVKCSENIRLFIVVFKHLKIKAIIE
ncbi:hypothetical protein CKF58_00745 [Psittacicella hinzii]|uniref:Uncharacterized protein n=1 Tax=Psittacicella hinzii TaxID=2028575 RepID=A0A3A1YS56_9GAMM|nr:hypothetical protein CKF58_00745 [Psittacicella hinzii]